MSVTEFSYQSVLVIDVGGTSLKCGFVVDGVPLEYERLFPASLLRNSDPIGNFARIVNDVLSDAGVKPDLLVSTVPGFIDTDGDQVLFAGNLLQLNGHYLASELGAQIGLPVVLERDSVLALSGELIAGAGQGAESALGIYFGTGVGAAFLQGGHPFRGSGWALEIGHMPFKGEGHKLDGLRADCLETYVSGRVLQLIADRHRTPIAKVFSMASQVPALGRDIDQFIKDQALAIGTAVALFSPGTIIVGGGVCAIEAFPRQRLAQLVAANAPFAETGRPMDLRWAELGWQAVLHGALQVAREHLRDRDRGAVADGSRPARLVADQSHDAVAVAQGRKP
jgi:allose kinase